MKFISPWQQHRKKYTISIKYNKKTILILIILILIIVMIGIVRYDGPLFCVVNVAIKGFRVNVVQYHHFFKNSKYFL